MNILAALSFMLILSFGFCRPVSAVSNTTTPATSTNTTTPITATIANNHNNNTTTTATKIFGPLLGGYFSFLSNLSRNSSNKTEASKTWEEMKEDFKIASKMDQLLQETALVLLSRSPAIRFYMQWAQRNQSALVLLPKLVKEALRYSIAGSMVNEVVTEMKNRPSAAKLWLELHDGEPYKLQPENDEPISSTHRAASRTRRTLGTTASPIIPSGFGSTMGRFTSKLLQYKVRAIEAVSGFVVKMLGRGISALS
ncbi:hypothetical protein Pcinc_034302 [Petrolisthes cinctipes]|uniref:Uncharacterized protein n=1 Tax=Petrolisthes cinctipes TaxID=88211 RepID=A0AAE1EQK4_PETCI|nr:hypothetical protein Pcinc_034302 [Petrolisthes cinctipes]